MTTTTTHGVAPYPLYWPPQYPRAKERRDATFQVDFMTSRAELVRELRLLGATDVVLSSNVPIRKDGLPYVPDREPTDPAVAIYFLRGSKPYVLACDQFSKIRWNLRAIGKTIEALRSIERHGATAMMEQAFSGFAQLPAKTSAPAWRAVLTIPEGPCDVAVVRARFRELAKVHHPDQGGDGARMAAITEAYESAMAELAGSGRS
jgi:hypothetical protein